MQNGERALAIKRQELAGQLQEIHAACFAWAVHCCHGDRTEAEEVLQTVYLKILDGRACFDGQSAFKTWVYAVVRATAREMRRRVVRRLRMLGNALAGTRVAAEAEAPGNVQQAEIRRKVQSLLGSLSDRQQEVVRLVFYHDLTVEQAAQVMGVSAGSARVHYQRAKAGLRHSMSRYEKRYDQERGRTDKAVIS